MNIPIQFFFENTRITLKDRERLKTFISARIRKAGKTLETINYVFCTDEALKKLNRVHLGHNYHTDIITFDLSEDPKCIQAEIYISTDRVRANAKMYQSTINQELHRVAFHGILHLLGFKDKTFKHSTMMRQMEDRWLKAYF